MEFVSPAVCLQVGLSDHVVITFSITSLLNTHAIFDMLTFIKFTK